MGKPALLILSVPLLSLFLYGCSEPPTQPNNATVAGAVGDETVSPLFAPHQRSEKAQTRVDWILTTGGYPWCRPVLSEMLPGVAVSVTCLAASGEEALVVTAEYSFDGEGPVYMDIRYDCNSSGGLCITGLHAQCVLCTDPSCATPISECTESGADYDFVASAKKNSATATLTVYPSFFSTHTPAFLLLAMVVTPGGSYSLDWDLGVYPW